MPELDPRILAKIKKCLALSSSPNSNEAAIALKQAHALMERHGVSAQEIGMSDIGESTASSVTMSRDKPARWEASLAAIVGQAFGCKMMVSRVVYSNGGGHVNDGAYIFVGLKQQVEIASYTATVLIRKCKSARKKWLADNFAGLGTGVPGFKRKRTRMGDMFAEGWVASIAKLVADFANPPEIDAAIDRHIELRSNNSEASVRAIPSKEIGSHEASAAAAGVRAAKGEQIYRPMESGAAQAMLTERVIQS